VGAVHRRMFELKTADRAMGETTLTAAHVGEERAEVVGSGDSPAYLLRDADLYLLTRPSWRRRHDLHSEGPETRPFQRF
jgi:serine/threonine protein phosphatase PrpC